MTLLVETDESTPPLQEDLATWMNDYGQTFPVLSDPNWDVISRYSERTPSLPSHTLIGRGGEIRIASQPVSEDDIISALAQ